MKKILLTFVLVAGMLLGQAQAVTVTTMTTNICYWDDVSETFSLECVFDETQSSRISFNEEQTMFKHTTDDMTSTYYVDSQKHITENIDGGEVDYYWYEITSDVGNQYVLIINLLFDRVTFMAGDGSYTIQTAIKSIF